MSRTRLVMSLVLAWQRCPSVSPNPAVRDFDGCGRSSSRDDSCRRFTSHHKSFLYQCDPVSPRFPPLGIAYLAGIGDLATCPNATMLGSTASEPAASPWIANLGKFLLFECWREKLYENRNPFFTFGGSGAPCTLLDVPLTMAYAECLRTTALGHRPFDGACRDSLARSLGARERGQRHWQGARGGA